VVTVILELKELFDPNFVEGHDIADLDRVLLAELGPWLFRPADIAQRCLGTTGQASLSACVARVGWPAIDSLRGRFMLALLGNWDTTGQGTADWARYATAGDVSARAAFPMASSWKLDWGSLPIRVRDVVDAERLARAVEQSGLLLRARDLRG
jgi:hypothetical protein